MSQRERPAVQLKHDLACRALMHDQFHRCQHDISYTAQATVQGAAMQRLLAADSLAIGFEAGLGFVLTWDVMGVLDNPMGQRAQQIEHLHR